jgi:cytoskeletal protein CcmA (bactofilin family)
MVQVLIDFRHLARVRLVTLERLGDGRSVRGTFQVSSRVSPRSITLSAEITSPPYALRRDVLAQMWLDVLNKDSETIRQFAADSARVPSLNEPLNLFPLGGDDDVDRIDASLVVGTLEGTAIRPGSLTSDQVQSLDASKLFGKVHPERLRRSGVSFDMIEGDIDGSRIHPMTLDQRHIASVDAGVVMGELTNVTLPPNSVNDHHIAEVSWEKVVGRPPDEFFSQVRLEHLSGILRPDQLPSLVPAECVDLTGGLDLSLFTHGQLPIGCLPNASIESRHVRSLDASKLIGQLDGGIIAPGTVPSSALTTVNADAIVGDLKVDRIEAKDLSVRSLNIDGLVCEGPVSCSDLRVEGEVVASGNVSIEGGIVCQTIDAGVCLSAREIACDNIATETFKSRELCTETLDVGTATVRHLDAQVVDGGTITVSEAFIGRSMTRRLDAEYAQVENLEAEVLAAHTIGASNIDVNEISVSDHLQVQGRGDFGALCVSGRMDVAMDIVAKNVRSTNITTRELDVSGDIEAESAIIQGEVKVLESFRVEDRLVIDGSLEVRGAIDASELVIEAGLHASRVACTTLAVDGSAELGDTEVTGSVDVSGAIACNDFKAEGHLSCRSVDCESLATFGLVAEYVMAKNLSARDVDTASLITLDLTTDRLVANRVQVDSLVSAEVLACSHMDATDLNVSDRLEVSGSLVCQDATMGSLNTQSACVTGTLRTDAVEVEDDIIVAGVSMAAKLREYEERVEKAVAAFTQGRPLVFKRKHYYADTQYDEGHDRIHALSPAIPDGTISFDFPFPSLTHGLTLTEEGLVNGRGASSGLYPIALRASTVSTGEETHTLQINAMFEILGPARWITPVRVESVQKSVFSITLAAYDATDYADDEPRLPGVGVVAGAITGVVDVPGVYSVGAVALRALHHNNHVLRASRIFENTVRPVHPFVSTILISSAFATAGSPVTLQNHLIGTDDNATRLQINEAEPIHAPVEWVTPGTLFCEVGTVNVPIRATGAETYSMVARRTLPLEVRVLPSGHFSGDMVVSRLFTTTVRAHGSGGALRPAERGGHSDRTFDVTIRQPAVDFSALEIVLPTAGFHAGIGTVSFEVIHDLPNSYRLEVTGLA